LDKGETCFGFWEPGQPGALLLYGLNTRLFRCRTPVYMLKKSDSVKTGTNYE